MRIEVNAEQRTVLLRELEETLAGIGDAYRKANPGREWDPYDEANEHGLTILVRARDDLADDAPPWTLDAPRRDLELLLTRLRAGSRCAFGIRGDRCRTRRRHLTSPIPRAPTRYSTL